MKDPMIKVFRWLRQTTREIYQLVLWIILISIVLSVLRIATTHPNDCPKLVIDNFIFLSTRLFCHEVIQK